MPAGSVWREVSIQATTLDIGCGLLDLQSLVRSPEEQRAGALWKNLEAILAVVSLTEECTDYCIHRVYIRDPTAQRTTVTHPSYGSSLNPSWCFPPFKRVRKRHVQTGLGQEEAHTRVEDNDLPNAKLISERCPWDEVDVVIDSL